MDDAKPAPDAAIARQPFGMAESIDPRCVDPVDAALDRVLQCRQAISVILCPPAELPPLPRNGPSAHANWRNQQLGRTQSILLHKHLTSIDAQSIHGEVTDDKIANRV